MSRLHIVLKVFFLAIIFLTLLWTFRAQEYELITTSQHVTFPDAKLERYSAGPLELLATKGVTSKEHAEHLLQLRAYMGKYLFPPLDGPRIGGDYSQVGQAKFLDTHVFNRMRNGFFVEVGAYNGLQDSNSVFFEQSRGWRGLLAEPDPVLFHRVVARRRPAIVFNGCVGEKPGFLRFMPTSHNGLGNVHNEGKLVVRCDNITNLLLVIGRRYVNFFSLDVEGHEMDVLRGINFDLITIDVFTIEVPPPNDIRNYSKMALLREFLEPKGYVVGASLPDGCIWGRNCLDVVFIRNSSGLPIPDRMGP